MDHEAAILLDVDGVLLLPSHDAVREALSRIAFEPQASTIDRAEYVAMHAVDAVALPDDRSVERYWSAYARALGVPAGRVDPAVDAFLDVFTPGSETWTRPIEPSVRALRSLAADGTPIALVSNSHDRLEAELRDLEICQVGGGSGADVDAIIVSGVVGIEKPDRRIFELALGALGADASAAVHVGDSVRFDVKGANGAGIAAVHFDPFAVCGDRGHDHIASLDELRAADRP